MKLEKLKPGMVVYDVGRQKMGNTAVSTVAVWCVYIKSVDAETGAVLASWNSNPARLYYESSWSKWRLIEPFIIDRGMFGRRLATRAEIKAMKPDSKGKA